MSEKYDVVVVGGGPAGLSVAYFLADKGYTVVVLERGLEPGSKNVFGGRVYSYPLDKYFPGWRRDAPIERWVRREMLSILCRENMASIGYQLSRKPDGHDSFTVFLSRLLKWMASKVEEKNVLLASNVRVDEMLFRDGVACGVRAGEDKIEAEYVVIAEGANTLLLEKHGLRGRPSPRDIAVGVKEVVRVGREKINERFGLGDEEGLAQFLISPVFGGGFIYTMKEYVSVGVVYRLSFNNHVEGKDVIEELRMHPEISKLLEGGVPVEYSAHIIREGGYKDLMSKPYGKGYVVVGDAAGLILNTGFTVRGVDLAIESGRLAAEAITKTSPGEELSIYMDLLRRSGIIDALKKFKNVPEILSNQRIYVEYPDLICKLLDNIYSVDEFPETLNESLKKAVKGKTSIIRLLLDLLMTVRSL
ncbi:MAG: FAD-dependent oxidoreductase [Nitrososphaerota archaeon]